MKKSLIENEEGHQAEHDDDHEVEAASNNNHNSDIGFRAVLANLTMSFLLIVVATLVFFFPWMSVLADLGYVCLYALVILGMTLPISSEVI